MTTEQSFASQRMSHPANYIQWGRRETVQPCQTLAILKCTLTCRVLMYISRISQSHGLQPPAADAAYEAQPPQNSKSPPQSQRHRQIPPQSGRQIPTRVETPSNPHTCRDNVKSPHKLKCEPRGRVALLRHFGWYRYRVSTVLICITPLTLD